jgi:hypothetical protein
VGSNVNSFTDRAAEYRRLAAKTKDDWLHETCLRLAAHYEQLALDPSQGQEAAEPDISLDQLQPMPEKRP